MKRDEKAFVQYAICDVTKYFDSVIGNTPNVMVKMLQMPR